VVSGWLIFVFGLIVGTNIGFVFAALFGMFAHMDLLAENRQLRNILEDVTRGTE